MLEPLHHVQTCVTPGVFAMLCRVCEADDISMYALVKRALLAYLVAWVDQRPGMADYVLRPG